jgi:FAD synthetase
MVRVMAQGTFDVIHPGHLYYLRESRKLGDELAVVVARDERVRERKRLLFRLESRRETVANLEMVDEAYVGTEGSIYKILDTVDPDVITIGHDQTYDLEEVREDLEERGYGSIDLERIGAYEASDDEIVSSSEIKKKLAERE